jgi:hypothetical protein
MFKRTTASLFNGSSAKGDFLLKMQQEIDQNKEFAFEQIKFNFVHDKKR